MSPAEQLTYPEPAEAFWIGQAELGAGRAGDEALGRLTPAVAHLSDLFTTERPGRKFPDYFADPRLLAAYGVFFLPQSFTRTSFALAQVCGLRGWRPAAPAPAILDLGCGPGSCGVAAAHRLRQLGFGGIRLTGVDRSPSALAAMESFGGAVLGADATVRTRIGDASRPDTWPEGPFDLIVAGFVLNEMPQLDAPALLRWFEELKARLAPGGLILILEPALRITAERLQRLSDAVADGEMTRVAPELDARPDPQLGAGEHWSHETRAWDAPASAEVVNRHLHRDLREVRFSFAAFSDASLEPLPPGLARLVSDVQIIKGLLRFVTIREGRIESVEVPTRGLPKHEVKKLAARFGRGDIVRHPHPAAPKLRLANHRELEVFWTPTGS
ncbi:MAG: methyltransferase [Verrucomicrobiota bacterium]